MPEPKHVALVSFAGGNASAITGPLEVLEYAATHDGGNERLAVSVVTADGESVTCDGCVTITPIGSLETAGDVDLIFLAGMPCNIDEVVQNNHRVMEWLAAQHKRGIAIATVCPSQALLAQIGLLEGKTVAMHWSLIDEVRQRWPMINWTADRMVVEDRGIYSCCGATAAIDLTLYIVDQLCGRDVMTACAQWFLADLPRVRQNVPPPLFGNVTPDNSVMAPVESWILGHFHETIHFESLALQFGMSWRTFYRRFQDTFGDSPKVYLQKLRLNAARNMLENDAGSIDQIAAKVGYADPAFFRSLFKRYVGMTPSRYRDNFRFRALI